MKAPILPFFQGAIIKRNANAEASLSDFTSLQTHKDLVDGVTALASEVQSDQVLANLIRRKFAIKCTTGYSLNALVDFHTDDPIEMIKRLIIGSEGTFGFVSQATYNTVPEWPDKVRVCPPCPIFAGRLTQFVPCLTST